MRGSEEEQQRAERGVAAKAARRVAPDDHFDVLVDLGEDGEHAITVAKAGLKTPKALRKAIAASTLRRLGAEATPPQWRGKGGVGADAMSVTLTFDNQIDAPTQAALTDRMKMERVRSASSVVVMPT